MCLHARFPRLHRGFIETALAHALRRKGPDPHVGLRALLNEHGIMRRARGTGCAEVQVVAVTSPVIETGNDVDFDWAVVDPSSLRAVVQTAGRVWRHRVWRGDGPNVLILGRPAVAMETGRLAMPGVETRPHGDTLVDRPTLDQHEGREFAALAAPEAFDRIDAAALLDPAPSGLARAEAKLRADMLGWDGTGLAGTSPLARYAKADTARMMARPARLRAFRRQVARDIVLFQDEPSPGMVEWRVDLAPGTRASASQDAASLGLEIGSDPPPEKRLFEDLDALAWAAYLPGRSPDAALRRLLTRTRVTEYQEAVELRHAYTPWLGITRGDAEDVCGPFGKRHTEQ